MKGLIILSHYHVQTEAGMQIAEKGPSLTSESPVCLIVAIMSAVCCSNLISHHLQCRGGLSAMH